VSTTIAEPPVRATSQDGEKRILIPRASWKLYETFVNLLPESTPVRVAFDGRSMEIMVKGAVHDHFADLLDQFVKAVTGALGIPLKPMRETTWIRPEIERGLETDRCYYLVSAKITTALSALRRLSNDVSDYPDPDLAVEVDISPPEVDRLAIYAALPVTELWIFDGRTLTIKVLGADGRYQTVEASRFLTVRAEEIPRWLLEEDVSDYDAWIQRIRAWAREELRGRAGGEGTDSVTPRD
jgi:Uma2 family endonuclease